MSHSSTVQAAFATLELSSSASQEEVKAKYKKLALQCHPDKNPEDPNATVRFQKVGQAYNDLNRHFERRDQPSYAPPFGGNAPFGFGSPFGFDAYNAFNMSGRGGGHGPDCSCGMDESDDGYYDDDDDDDDMEFFMFIFAEMMRGRGRSYRKQRKTKEETPEEFAERVRRAREADEVNRQRRAQQDAARKERIQREAEEESCRAIERKKTKAAKKSAAHAKSQQDAKAKAELAAVKRQELRSTTFAAARAGDAAGVRKGVWDNSVDSSGPELIQPLEGGRASKETLLHIAASLKDLELVEWLINHSAEPEEKDGNGHTVFHRALAEGAPEILKYLFDTYEPIIDYITIFGAPKGDTIIRLAVSSGNAACVYAVLDAGLVDITDLNGAWEYLRESKVPEISPWKAVRQALLDVTDWTPPVAAPTPPPTKRSPHSPSPIPPAPEANVSSSTKKKRSDGPKHSKVNSPPRQSQNKDTQTHPRQPHTSPPAKQNLSPLRVPMGVATNDPRRKSKRNKHNNEPAKAPVSA